MKPKVLALSAIFVLAVYSVLLVYVFGLAPYITKKSMENWTEIEGSREKKFLDTKICAECHYKVFKGLKNHSSVSCEACHGAGAKHAITRSKEYIKIDRSREFCLKCHLDIPGRNAVKTVNITHHKGVLCVVCHNPHS